jgi:hypothetical protein
MSVDAEPPKKKYSPPSLIKRRREQATLFLMGYAWIGDTGARDLLEIAFPEPPPK